MRLIFCFVKDFNSIITRFFTSTRINISTPFRVKIIPGVIIIRWYYWAKVVYPGLDSTRACGPPQRTWTRVLHKPGMLTPGLELIYPMQLFCVREGQMTAIWVDCEDAFFVIIWYICVCALVCAEILFVKRVPLRWEMVIWAYLSISLPSLSRHICQSLFLNPIPPGHAKTGPLVFLSV